MNTTKNSSTITVYTGRLLKNHKPLYFFEDLLTGEKRNEKHLWNMFQGASHDVPFDFLLVTDDPAKADFFLMPYNFFSLKESGGAEAELYITHLITLSEKHKKKILVFCMDDSDKHVDLPMAIVFRYSQYKYRQKDNEIITPPYPLHFRNPGLEGYRQDRWKEIIFRDKRDKPVVSFCGWAGFPNLYRTSTYAARVLLADIKAYIFLGSHAALRKPAIYFRRKAIKSVERSTRLETSFIIRKSYSAQKGFDGKHLIKPETAEKEYIENIINSDLVLAARGHANASMRFFEALGLGRFPVLINTDCVLPLKNHIDYDKFVVTVDHTRMEDIEQKILDFYNSFDDEELKKRQKMARDAFEMLRPGSFLKITLSELKQKN